MEKKTLSRKIEISNRTKTVCNEGFPPLQAVFLWITIKISITSKANNNLYIYIFVRDFVENKAGEIVR